MADPRCPSCGGNHGAVDRVEIHFADGTTAQIDDEAAEAWIGGDLSGADWRVWHGAPMAGEVCSICGQPVGGEWARVGDKLRHPRCRETVGE